MSTIPTNLARLPNALASQIIMSSLQRTQRAIFDLQVQLSTGLRVNTPSDDVLAASSVTVLDDIIENRDQHLRNLSQAESMLNNIEGGLSEANALFIEAKGVAASQIGIGSDTETRANQAHVITAFLDEMFAISNRALQGIQLFGGNRTAVAPMEQLFGGFVYQGQGTGLVTDLGQSRSIPVTIGGDEAFGAISSRVKGNNDLDPTMTTATRLLDINGARNLGISKGTFNADVGGADVTVDISKAHTVADVITALNTAIQAQDAGATFAIDPLSNNKLQLSGNTVAITVSDLGSGKIAADLGIDKLFAVGPPVLGTDLDPKLTELTPLGNLTGVTFPLGTIRLENGGQVRNLDLSAALNVQDVMNAVKALDIGIRVEIASTGDRLDFVNELSGGMMAVAEVGASPTTTATQLGVRSYDTWTKLSDFNRGRGIQILSGNVDPVTGLPDPTRDTDLRVTLRDNQFFDVDLAGSTTVQDVIDAINNAATATIGGGFFVATLAADGNGIQMNDLSPPAGGTFEVSGLNGSFAAEDLGMLGQVAGATITAQDRAKVAVESVFTHLIDLRDALKADDELGITLAGERMEADITQLAEVRARVGVSTRQVTTAVTREEDLRIQDMGLRSLFRDLDFTEATIRFSTLQTQLQAGLTTAAQVQTLSLLDFLR